MRVVVDEREATGDGVGVRQGNQSRSRARRGQSCGTKPRTHTHAKGSFIDTTSVIILLVFLHPDRSPAVARTPPHPLLRVAVVEPLERVDDGPLDREQQSRAIAQGHKGRGHINGKEDLLLESSRCPAKHRRNNHRALVSTRSIGAHRTSLLHQDAGPSRTRHPSSSCGKA